MQRSKTTLLLGLGLASLTVCIAMAAFLFGLFPDSQKTELRSRAKVAEALAIQLAGAINRNDRKLAEGTIETVVGRNPEIKSVAFRNTKGVLLVSSGDHEQNWRAPPDGNSTPTHVVVPLYGEKGLQGNIEVAFKPLASGGRILDVPFSLLSFLGFIAITGFLVYSLFLRRALHELDPGRVIPERVQRAFDTLSEAVIILDERERVLLANKAFYQLYGTKKPLERGFHINTLAWRMPDGAAIAGEYPWHAAIRENRETREGIISLRTPEGVLKNLSINATVFHGDKGNTIGAIATFNDITTKTQSAQQLMLAVKQLEETQEELMRQRQELDFLSNHDPLTGCLNRNSFFARFEPKLEEIHQSAQMVTLLLIDVDGLRRAKKQFGPAVTDTMQKVAAKVLKSVLPADALVGRYGSDGFCVAQIGLQPDAVASLVHEFQTAFAQDAKSVLPQSATTSFSVGICSHTYDGTSAVELVRRADSALQAALGKGAGQYAYWQDVGSKTAANKNLAMTPVSDAGGPNIVLNPAFAEGLPSGPAAAERTTQFYNAVERSIERSKRNNKPLAVLKVGISSWNALEEGLGVELGLSLLRVAKRNVKLEIRDHDQVVLLPETGELLVELSELDQADDVTWICKRIQDRFTTPIQVGQQTIFVVCKIGAALFPGDGHAALELARHAGVALRRARADKSIDGLRYYAAEMTQNAYQNLEIESGTRAALKNNQFQLVFQPIVDAKTGEVRAAETLLRCTNPQLSGVRIDQIIEVAERTSLSAEIDLWVLTEALCQMMEWDRAGLHLPKISVNLSANQLMNLELMEQIFAKIENAGFAPSRIQIEVTETAKMIDIELAAKQLKRLQNLGVHIALDDFGTGQASLAYLQRLHPDVIKIDRSFVAGANSNHANATMVGAMTVMAHCLGLKVVAEGVETDEELEFLRESGCDEIQGYLISKPMPAKTLSDWMGLFSRGERADPPSNRNLSTARKSFKVA